MRMAQSGISNIDTLAREHRLSRSDVIRAMLTVAARHPEETTRALQQLTIVRSQ